MSGAGAETKTSSASESPEGRTWATNVMEFTLWKAPLRICRWVKSTVKGVLGGAVTATFGAAGEALNETGRGIAATAAGMTEAVNEARREMGERRHIGKLSPLIKGVINTTRQAVQGIVKLPFRIAAGAAGKIPEGAGKIVSGVLMREPGEKKEESKQ